MSMNNKIRRANAKMQEILRKNAEPTGQKPSSAVFFFSKPGTNEDQRFDSKRALLSGSMRRRRRTRNYISGCKKSMVAYATCEPQGFVWEDSSVLPGGEVIAHDCPITVEVSFMNSNDIELQAPVNTSPNIELSQQEVTRICNACKLDEAEMTKAEEQLVECLKKTTMLEFDSVDKLPEVGDTEALYFIRDKEAIYCWRGEEYDMLGLSETLELTTKSPAATEAVRELPVLGWARKLWGTLTSKIAGTTPA